MLLNQFVAMTPIPCKLVYRHVLDATVASAFEKAILHLSYEEFLIKSQAYNLEQHFTTYRQMVASDPKANSLHYKLGSVVAHSIDQLANKNPYLYDNLGTSVPFDTCQFKLIDSDLTHQSAHKIALFFTSHPYEFIQNVGDYVWLRERTKLNPYAEDYETTILVKLQPNLSFIDVADVLPPSPVPTNLV